jgi:hypothetical protein
MNHNCFSTMLSTCNPCYSYSILEKQFPEMNSCSYFVMSPIGIISSSYRIVCRLITTTNVRLPNARLLTDSLTRNLWTNNAIGFCRPISCFVYFSSSSLALSLVSSRSTTVIRLFDLRIVRLLNPLSPINVTFLIDRHHS